MAIKVSNELILYDVKDLSKLFAITEKTARQLFKTGKLKGRKVGRRWYVTEPDLKAYFIQEPRPPSLADISRQEEK